MTLVQGGLYWPLPIHWRPCNRALRDRMEIIEVNWVYHGKKRLEIAKKHLVPKQREEHGLKAKDIVFFHMRPGKNH